MAGRFEGLTNTQWKLLEPFFPKNLPKRSKGKPHTPWRNVCNSLFWILITGSRWCDLPKGAGWGSRSATHRWLGKWQENGTLDTLLTALKDQADLAGLIKWERLAADGFFSGGKGGGELVDYGYKGEGMTTHLLVDGQGNPLSFEVTSAKGDERKQVEKLIDVHMEKLQKLYELYQVIPIFEADKGYDSEELRDKLLRRKIYPFIPRRRTGPFD